MASFTYPALVLAMDACLGSIHAQEIEGCALIERIILKEEGESIMTRTPYFTQEGFCPKFCTVDIFLDNSYSDDCKNPCCIRTGGNQPGSKLQAGECVSTCADTATSPLNYEGPSLFNLEIEGCALVERIILKEEGESIMTRTPYFTQKGFCPKFCTVDIFLDNSHSDDCNNPCCIRTGGNQPGSKLQAGECVSTCADTATSPLNYEGPSLFDQATFGPGTSGSPDTIASGSPDTGGGSETTATAAAGSPLVEGTSAATTGDGSASRETAPTATTAADEDSKETSWVAIAAGVAGAAFVILLLSVLWCCWCRPRMRQSTNVVIHNKQGTHPLHPHAYTNTPPSLPVSNAGFVHPEYHHGTQNPQNVPGSAAPYNSGNAWGSMHAGHALEPQQSWPQQIPPHCPAAQGQFNNGQSPFVMSAQASGSTISASGPGAIATTASQSTRSSMTRSPGGTWTMQTVPVKGVTSGGVVATGAAEGDMDAERERLEVELDSMRATKELFLGRYEVLSAMERRLGGQGLVQFMRAANSEEAVAVKFFFRRAAFDSEVELYEVPTLRSMMPAIHGFVGNDLHDSYSSGGYEWPPCIIIERGESLQEWAQREEHDFVTIIQVLYHVAERLAALHRSGWVHRDLKPGNVLRRPRQHAWTLIDFGCAAQIGSEVSITYTLAYMPPEVAIAVERGDRTIVADAAADVWALGVMAYELLTKTTLFPLLGGENDDSWGKLLGKSALPWEHGSEGASERQTQLRALKRGVLACLQRNPEERPTCESVLGTWTNIFDTQSRTRTSRTFSV